MKFSLIFIVFICVNLISAYPDKDKDNDDNDDKKSTKDKEGSGSGEDSKESESSGSGDDKEEGSGSGSGDAKDDESSGKDESKNATKSDEKQFNCKNMLPSGNSNSPKPINTSKFKIKFNKIGDDKISVSIVTTDLESNGFKGFIVEARSTEKNDKAIYGSWMDTGMTSPLDCNEDNTSSAIMNSDDSSKKSINLFWKPPTGSKAPKKYVFVATVLENKENFWVGIQSDTLKIGESNVKSEKLHPIGSVKSSKMTHSNSSTTSGVDSLNTISFATTIIILAIKYFL